MRSGVSAEKTYDGTAFTLNKGDFAVYGLPAGGACDLDISSYTAPVNAGDRADITVRVKNVTVNGVVLSESAYSCQPLTLTLTIAKRPIAVTVTAQKVYDGTPLDLQTAASVTYASGTGELLAGHRIVAAGSAVTLTDAGSTTAAIDAAKVRIQDAYGYDVTGNYNVTGGSATLTVTKRPLMIRTSSAIKLYDGTPLTDHTTPSVTGLVSGHRLPITFTGKQEKVGSSANTIKTDFKITYNDIDVTGNYDISYSFGTLTVLRATDLTYYKGTRNDLTLTLDVDYSDFSEVMLERETLGSDCYTSSAGSTIITLKGRYLETLKVGTYDLTVKFKNANDIKLKLTVSNGDQPKTGDDQQIGKYIAVAAAALVLIVAGVILLIRMNRKEERKDPKESSAEASGKHAGSSHKPKH